MNYPRNPDGPIYDPLAFEQEAKARAAEFDAAVQRLAVHDVCDPVEWVDEKGAIYEMLNGGEVAVKSEQYHTGPEETVAKARVVDPVIETVGVDGARRLVRATRYVVHKTFRPDDGINEVVQAMLDERPEDAEELARLLESARRNFAERRLEDSLTPGFRPGELIWACSRLSVERQLPNSPNYRTERFAEDMPDITKFAFIAAVRLANDIHATRHYSIPEHKGLLALLDTFNPLLTPALPLDDDFDQEWLGPEPTLRSWFPSK